MFYDSIEPARINSAFLAAHQVPRARASDISCELTYSYKNPALNESPQAVVFTGIIFSVGKS